MLGRTDGAIALYDAIMQSEKAACVLDGMPGPVTSIDVAADGSMVVWTTPEFVFFSCPSETNWPRAGPTGASQRSWKLCVPPDAMEAMVAPATAAAAVTPMMVKGGEEDDECALRMDARQVRRGDGQG